MEYGLGLGRPRLVGRRRIRKEEAEEKSSLAVGTETRRRTGTAMGELLRWMSETQGACLAWTVCDGPRLIWDPEATSTAS